MIILSKCVVFRIANNSLHNTFILIVRAIIIPLFFYVLQQLGYLLGPGNGDGKLMDGCIAPNTCSQSFHYIFYYTMPYKSPPPPIPRDKASPFPQIPLITKANFQQKSTFSSFQKHFSSDFSFWGYFNFHNKKFSFMMPRAFHEILWSLGPYEKQTFILFISSVATLQPLETVNA